METGETLNDWGDASVALVFKKRGQKNSLVDYGLLSLTSVPGKMMEQALLEDISMPMKENKVMGNSQYGFIKGE